VAAALSRDLVLAKIRLMWLLMVWLLRTRVVAIFGVGHARAVCARPQVRRLFAITGLDRQISLARTVTEACRSLARTARTG
jgi:hypothetical protein